MEKLYITFNVNDIKPFQIHPKYVPDALLPKVWFQSDTSKAHPDRIMHRQQIVEHNRVVPGQEYIVRIKLVSAIERKKFKIYTYEMRYSERGAIKGLVRSIFVEALT